MSVTTYTEGLSFGFIKRIFSLMKKKQTFKIALITENMVKYKIFLIHQLYFTLGFFALSMFEVLTDPVCPATPEGDVTAGVLPFT